MMNSDTWRFADFSNAEEEWFEGIFISLNLILLKSMAINIYLPRNEFLVIAILGVCSNI